ncbi:MAG: NUDIX hydrolase, partial [Nanoarchaeota archaeon]|nr:NUDIX hydrolase [Nanoarchaeota archaeon]
TWALPGGFLRFGETLEEGTKREVLEETGLNISPGELIGVYADPKRDPRGHVISIVFFAEARSGKLKRQESEIADLGFFDKLPANLTPSHKQIIYDALKKRGLEM